MKATARLARFPEYVFAHLMRQVAQVEAATGRKVLSFGVGNPDFPPSPQYLEKYAEFVKEPDSHAYPDARRSNEFTDAVIIWYQKRFGVALERDEVLPLLGAKEGAAHLPLALTDPGDEVLIPDPGYLAFAGSTLVMGATPVFYDLLPEKEFAMSLGDIGKMVSPRTKYMWVNFPSNPTGAIVERAQLEAIGAFSKKYGVPVAYDNAYSEITFDGFKAPSILQIPDAKEWAVEIGSFSKTFSFAGFRMGWMVGNREIVGALAKVKSQMDSGLSIPLQRLGAYALTHPDPAWSRAMIESYKSRRDTIAEKLKKLGLTFELPHAALYIWAKIPDSAKDSESYCMELLREKKVLFAPGSAFGKNGERYVRVSICVDINDIDEYL
jgi:LL-diaminopimelate aminotransferase